MQKECFCCGKLVDVSADTCPQCLSGHTGTGTLECFFNGMLARRLEVGWCRTCDATWILDGNGERAPVCDECRERALKVDLPQIVQGAAA